MQHLLVHLSEYSTYVSWCGHDYLGAWSRIYLMIIWIYRMLLKFHRVNVHFFLLCFDLSVHRLTYCFKRFQISPILPMTKTSESLQFPALQLPSFAFITLTKLIPIDSNFSGMSIFENDTFSDFSCVIRRKARFRQS